MMHLVQLKITVHVYRYGYGRTVARRENGLLRVSTHFFSINIQNLLFAVCLKSMILRVRIDAY